MSIDAKRSTAAAAFAVLLILSVWWPSPVIAVNELCCHASLGIDQLSFLGREQPRWDVAFWLIAGVFVIALLQSGQWRARDFREVWTMARSSRYGEAVAPLPLALGVVCAAVAVAVTWRFADSQLVAWCESYESQSVDDTIRIFNRLGGGMNPPMIILFFVLAGVVYRHRRWVAWGVSMAIAAIAAGLFAQIVKYLAGRARPELWLGPFTHARPSATSFPSGHTIAAFALAGVLLFASRGIVLRAVALILALCVAAARVLAFRHWPSDVLASALIALLVAWIVTTAVMRLTKTLEEPS
jgi:membrane-associated phospholipid phosphatase